MKNESLILEANLVETAPKPVGLAFDHANTIKAPRVEAPQASVPERSSGGGMWSAMGNFLKPAIGNLFLLGCLLGLFVLYCCSCIIHALTLPSGRKSS
jgi:hypothetical protein